jgi:hypothetical protein
MDEQQQSQVGSLAADSQPMLNEYSTQGDIKTNPKDLLLQGGVIDLESGNLTY